MKITTYSTHEQANRALSSFYFKNALVIYGIYSQFTPIAKNFQRTVVRASKEQAHTLAQEFKDACSQLGRGDKITAPFKLHNCIKGYGFKINYLDDEANIMWGYFKSIDALTTEVREQVSQSPFSFFGVKETPFLYTVTEPYHFSKKEKKEIREKCKYEGMSPNEKSNLDSILEAYTEYGLGPEEIKEFEKNYTRFFN